jgi:effector-binding domain-containing protein
VPDDVVIRGEPEHRYLALRTRQPSFAAAVAMVLEMHREVPPQVGRGVLGTFVGVAHSAEFEPDDLDVELGFTLESEPKKVPVIAGRPLEIRTLPAHAKVATCVRVGSPVNAHLATAKIARYLEATGFKLAGPSREIFLEPPREGKIDTAVVEMAFPVEPC